MTGNEFQREAHVFATKGQKFLYPVIGLSAECGELAGAVQKYVRYHGTYPETGRAAKKGSRERGEYEALRTRVAQEAGDCLWFLAEIATNFDLDIEGIMEYNLRKLRERADAGCICGSGESVKERRKGGKGKL